MKKNRCRKDCPYRVGKHCHKPAVQSAVSFAHDCPNCPYLSVCQPGCGMQGKRGNMQVKSSCFLEDGMV